MEEALARGWANLVGRLDGPLHLRFILQPTVAILLAVRAGRADARSRVSPLFGALVRSDQRRARLADAVRDVAKVLVVAAVLDGVYQVTVHHAIYLFELSMTAALLALVPYGLARDVTARVATAWITRAHRNGGDDG